MDYSLTSCFVWHIILSGNNNSHLCSPSQRNNDGEPSVLPKRGRMEDSDIDPLLEQAVQFRCQVSGGDCGVGLECSGGVVMVSYGGVIGGLVINSE